MAGDARTPVRLADPEVEPSDKQLDQLMDWVAESVREKAAQRKPSISAAEISAMADELVAQFLTGEK